MDDDDDVVVVVVVMGVVEIKNNRLKHTS